MEVGSLDWGSAVALLRHICTLRSGWRWGQGVRAGWWHCCIIPASRGLGGGGVGGFSQGGGIAASTLQSESWVEVVSVGQGWAALLRQPLMSSMLVLTWHCPDLSSILGSASNCMPTTWPDTTASLLTTPHTCTTSKVQHERANLTMLTVWAHAVRSVNPSFTPCAGVCQLLYCRTLA